MRAIDLLKNDDYLARLSYEDKWLIYGTGWVVYQRKYGQKISRVLVNTEDEEKAVKVLIEG